MLILHEDRFTTARRFKGKELDVIIAHPVRDAIVRHTLLCVTVRSVGIDVNERGPLVSEKYLLDIGTRLPVAELGFVHHLIFTPIDPDKAEVALCNDLGARLSLRLSAALVWHA